MQHSMCSRQKAPSSCQNRNTESETLLHHAQAATNAAGLHEVASFTTQERICNNTIHAVKHAKCAMRKARSINALVNRLVTHTCAANLALRGAWYA